jgi:3-oxoacyl-[acyl-carrier-protein] synthase-3
MAIGIEQGWLRPGDHVAMMGIGSGINCLILGAEWQTAAVGASPPSRQGATVR